MLSSCVIKLRPEKCSILKTQIAINFFFFLKICRNMRRCLLTFFKHPLKFSHENQNIFRVFTLWVHSLLRRRVEASNTSCSFFALDKIKIKSFWRWDWGTAWTRWKLTKLFILIELNWPFNWVILIESFPLIIFFFSKV